MNHRTIFYHKHRTSARTQFLRFSYNSILGFTPTEIAAVEAAGDVDEDSQTSLVLKGVEQELGIAVDDLQFESEFHQLADTPDDQLHIFLVGIVSLDVPKDKAEALNARFIDITQARDLPRVELELLRSAYECILGGG